MGTLPRRKSHLLPLLAVALACCPGEGLSGLEAQRGQFYHYIVAIILVMTTDVVDSAFLRLLSG